MKLSDQQKAKMSEYGIPSYMHGALTRYYENGLGPGNFLTAVINNDLSEAVGRADEANVVALKAYVMWFYNQAPMGSWGSPGAAEKWIENFEKEVA